eukprot:GILI01011608.1.p1 GENE.GILI01011608.1~~GILI01011608.1.p1  ORF type:complete len:555 (-),score=194.33 GILI01011608.1:209-1795(-)
MYAVNVLPLSNLMFNFAAQLQNQVGNGSPYAWGLACSDVASYYTPTTAYPNNYLSADYSSALFRLAWRHDKVNQNEEDSLNQFIRDSNAYADGNFTFTLTGPGLMQTNDSPSIVIGFFVPFFLTVYFFAVMGRTSGFELELEFTPQGTLAERMRAGGAGIPAFFTATGYGTQIAEGGIPLRFNKDGTVAKEAPPKETRQFGERWYVMEHAIKTDFSIIKGWKADKSGNIMFRGTAQNFNPAAASCGKVCIAEVEEIVENGELDPNQIHLPGVYVHRIVKPEAYEKKIEFRTIAGAAPAKKGAEGKKDGGMDVREKIARRAAQEFQDGMYVNLGIGIPTLSANYVKPGVSIELQSENGLLGMGPFPTNEAVDPDLINAGKQTVSYLPTSAIFTSDQSFAMIRGGHMDLTMLGALQVAPNGDLANWIVPGKLLKGMGGAMDLVSSGCRVIVLMEHTSKGEIKIVANCSLPLTGKRVVDRIITELCVFDIDRTGSNGMTLIELAPGVTVEDIKKVTGAPFTVSDKLKTIEY